MGGIGGEMMVGIGRTKPGGFRGDGNSGVEGRQGWAGGVKEGDQNRRLPELGQRKWVQSISINQIGT